MEWTLEIVILIGFEALRLTKFSSDQFPVSLVILILSPSQLQLEKRIDTLILQPLALAP